ncbi:hypothetical protein OS493_030245 [Desmophyllum pertusum]|uniref:Uncharacterized protein n=1 Tax=Desmophyllum pertusum TaxID=174260 RepID=A0A9W9YA88_9CNID|nr:hypothetical protein OS493_030245 [Desmophyllum pertusum]
MTDPRYPVDNAPSVEAEVAVNELQPLSQLEDGAQVNGLNYHVQENGDRPDEHNAVSSVSQREKAMEHDCSDWELRLFNQHMEK